MGPNEYMICDYRVKSSKWNTRLAKMPVLGVLVLFVRIRVGIRILRQIKGEHFADDAISLLWINTDE